MTFQRLQLRWRLFHELRRKFTTVFSDSRDIKAGEILLQELNFDGHDFVSSPRGGAVGAIVEHI